MNVYSRRRYVRSAAPLSQPPVISLWSKNNDDVSRPVKKKYKRTNRRVCRNSITIARKHRGEMVERKRGRRRYLVQFQGLRRRVCHCYDDLVSAAVWRAWRGRCSVGRCRTRSIDKELSMFRVEKHGTNAKGGFLIARSRLRNVTQIDLKNLTP